MAVFLKKILRKWLFFLYFFLGRGAGGEDLGKKGIAKVIAIPAAGLGPIVPMIGPIVSMIGP